MLPMQSRMLDLMETHISCGDILDQRIWCWPVTRCRSGVVGVGLSSLDAAGFPAGMSVSKEAELLSQRLREMLSVSR